MLLEIDHESKGLVRVPVLVNRDKEVTLLFGISLAGVDANHAGGDVGVPITPGRSDHEVGRVDSMKVLPAELVALLESYRFPRPIHVFVRPGVLDNGEGVLCLVGEEFWKEERDDGPLTIFLVPSAFAAEYQRDLGVELAVELEPAVPSRGDRSDTFADLVLDLNFAPR